MVQYSAVQEHLIHFEMFELANYIRLQVSSQKKNANSLSPLNSIANIFVNLTKNNSRYTFNSNQIANSCLNDQT